MEDLTVKITTKHFKKAGDANQTKDCPLYHALKDIFPDRDITVGFRDAWISFKGFGEEYQIQGWSADMSSAKEWLGNINKLIERAKSGKRVPTHTAVIKRVGASLLKEAKI